MKRSYSVVVLIVVLVLVFLNIRVRLYMTEGGQPNTSSPVDAHNKGILIRKVVPSLKELQYNEKNNILIENAWLEKKIVQRNCIFWVGKGIDPNRYVVKLSYKLKNISTGATFSDTKAWVLLNRDKEPGLLTEKWQNIISVVLKGNPQNEFTLKIACNGQKEETVRFK